MILFVNMLNLFLYVLPEITLQYPLSAGNNISEKIFSERRQETMNPGQIIIKEIDNRISRLNKHYSDKKDTGGNPFGEVLSAEAKIINTALANELRSLKEFVQTNIGS